MSVVCGGGAFEVEIEAPLWGHMRKAGFKETKGDAQRKAAAMRALRLLYASDRTPDDVRSAAYFRLFEIVDCDVEAVMHAINAHVAETGQSVPSFPAPFGGEGRVAKRFLRDFSATAAMFPQLLRGDEDRIFFASAFLRGEARAWFVNDALTSPDAFRSFAVFAQRFEAHFVTPEVAARASQRLARLAQGARPFPAFQAEFDELAALAGLSSDEARVFLLRNGLHAETRARVAAARDVPGRYARFAELCARVDAARRAEAGAEDDSGLFDHDLRDKMCYKCRSYGHMMAQCTI